VTRLLSIVLLLLGISLVGCSSSDGAPGGSGGDLEWPPDATVYFDENRVFNADCATDEDCAMALGYYHAFDRFVQMDLRRRLPTGRIGDILAPDLAGLLSDDFADLRALYTRRDGTFAEEFLYEQSSPKTKALLDAYTVGVNKWISDLRAGENGATFPREFTHPALDYSPDRIPEWTPQDSVAAILAVIEGLTNDESDQIDGAVAREKIGNDDKFSDLWSRRPLEESAILPLDWTPEPPPSAAEKRASVRVPRVPTPLLRPNAEPALRRLQAKLERTAALRNLVFGPGDRAAGDTGSNNWVIGPSLTTEGNALLCNDPHLGMSQPAFWYIAHLDAKTNGNGQIHAAGGTFAGLPWILMGQNEDIAWGLTTTYMDLSDVYVETLVTDADGNPTGVMFEGEEVPFTRVPWTVDFSDGTSEEKELLIVPHHGPVREIDAENGTALTLRWTGSDIDTDINYPTELGVATNIEEAKAAISNITTAGQNLVVIDSDDKIGWFPYNRLPKRTWATDLDGEAPSWLPLDGASGAFEWDDYFALSELPQAMNPASGYIATANNDMTGALFDGDPTTLPSGRSQPPYQVWAVAGFRHKQITNLIEAVGNEHTRETMDAIIGDIYSLIGERMVPKMLELARDPETLPGLYGTNIIRALESWDFTCPTGIDGIRTDSPLVDDGDELIASSGCTAFHALLDELRLQIEKNENARPGRAPSFATYYSIVDPSRLAAGDVYWDDPLTEEVQETKYDVMSAALQNIGDFLVDQLGEDETKWAWGRLHGMLLSSDLSGISSVFSQYDNPPPGEPLFANDGGLFTVDVANPREGDFIQTAGPTTRFVCEASESGPSCTIMLPGGQSGDIESPHYEDLLPGWLDNVALPLVFDIEEAKANAAETITFE
jgi:penicillin amidase